MQARELMTDAVHCCTPATSIRDAAKILKDYDIGSLPVVESEQRRKLVGVVTDRDIVIRLIAQGMNPLECNVEDAMTGQAFSVHPEASEEEVARCMEDHQVRRVPVVDNNDVCVGVISQADIARKAPEHETAEVVKDISQPAAA